MEKGDVGRYYRRGEEWKKSVKVNGTGGGSDEKGRYKTFSV